MKLTRQGVRDLDGDFRASDVLPPPKPAYKLEPDIRPVHDLIYSEDVLEFKERFPQAQLSAEWDEIHETRYQIDIPAMDWNEYLEFLIHHGRTDSFALQILMYTELERVKAILWKVKMKEAATKPQLREQS